MFKIFKENKLLQKLNNNKYFEELICIIICALTIITWLTNYSIGLFFILLVAFILLLLFNDFKYMMPIALSIIFSQNSGFSVNEVPMFSIIGGFAFIALMLVFMIKNKLRLRNAKSWIPILWLSISCFLPILWRDNVGENQYGLYFLYFSWILYFLLYIVFAGSLKGNSFRMLCYTMTWLGVLLTLQCGIAILRQYQNGGEIFKNFKLGWGICNEAGIMILVSLPFIFIRLIKSDTILKVLYSVFMIFFFIFGMILTNSRGTYLFGAIELLCLFVISLIYGKKKITTLLCYVSIAVVAILALQFKFGLNNIFQLIREEVYGFTIDINNDGKVDFSDFIETAFNDNGRVDLWNMAMNIWEKAPINKFLGVGMIPEYYSYDPRPIVYHSTTFETLACFGIVGMIGLVYHIIQKYFRLMKFERGVLVIMAFGYACVDMYGMLDNTYHMYYYMVPLMIIMACIDCYNEERVLV